MKVDLDMEPETVEYIIRSRSTILDIVENRGYNIESYKNVSPEDILKLATTSSKLLQIKATKTIDDVEKRCIVEYWVENAVRLRLDTEINTLLEQMGDEKADEIIVILAEPFHEVFHLHANKQWQKNKIIFSFFNLKNVISNPARHIMVPPHRKLNTEEVAIVIRDLYLKSKSELPHIKYHVDMQARVLGLIPGDIVEIQRPSETCGVYTMYRVCSL
jgi:DNA-directed RNA polymerase subunit H (RpoH/RPB5)